MLVVKVLQHGCEPDVRDKLGQTAIHLAIAKTPNASVEATINSFLNNGVNVDALKDTEVETRVKRYPKLWEVVKKRRGVEKFGDVVISGGAHAQIGDTVRSKHESRYD